jgi:hypothetical protein
MAPEAVFAQITHEVSSALRTKTTTLHVCCVCRFALDETGPSLDHERWVTQRTLQMTHGVNPADCLLTHTYCPVCFTQVMDRIRECSSRHETAP